MLSRLTRKPGHPFCPGPPLSFHGQTRPPQMLGLLSGCSFRGTLLSSLCTRARTNLGAHSDPTVRTLPSRPHVATEGTGTLASPSQGSDIFVLRVEKARV